MNARPHLALALSIFLAACGTAPEEAIGPQIPEVKSSELERQIVPGPSLQCESADDRLYCELAVADGFRVAMVSILVLGADKHLEEVAFLGDAEVGVLTAGRTHVATLPPDAEVDIQIHYTSDALESLDSTLQSEAAVRCQVQVGSASNVVCEAGDYERWSAFLVPDHELAAEWEERTQGTPGVRTTILSEADDDRLCFREYPRCEREGLVEHWTEIAADGDVPESVRYGFTLPAESAHSEVLVATNVMFDPVPIEGPGIYVVGADGTVTPH